MNGKSLIATLIDTNLHFSGEVSPRSSDFVAATYISESVYRFVAIKTKGAEIDWTLKMAPWWHVKNLVTIKIPYICKTSIFINFYFWR